MPLPVIARFALLSAVPFVARMLRRSAARRRTLDPDSPAARAMEIAAMGLAASAQLRSWRGGPRKWAVKAAQAAALGYATRVWAKARKPGRRRPPAA